MRHKTTNETKKQQKRDKVLQNLGPKWQNWDTKQQKQDMILHKGGGKQQKQDKTL